jgi:predicted PhzF superfamily epimerase YddE/YHI9
MSTPIYKVDSFTNQPFGGNPAGVCLLREARDERWMQSVAREMNLSETAFLVPRGGDYDLRWFTPSVEIALCGHATLASAHILWETKRLATNAPARFHTMSGLLTCTRDRDRIAMDFPTIVAVEAAPPPELLRALGVRATFAGNNKMDWLVEVDSEATVRALAPDFALLKTIPVRGVIVTARAAHAAKDATHAPSVPSRTAKTELQRSSTAGARTAGSSTSSAKDASAVGAKYDFVSRFFAPRAGVDEDPVTGSAHCCLAPYWGTKLEKKELVGWQASARGGEVRMKWNGDRVVLSGQAVTVLRGELV